MFLHQHLDLLERDRTWALHRAVRTLVRPGSTVLDAGTGSGVLAVWAAMAGAKRVVAVDREHAPVARALAEDNGVADRIEVVTGDLWTLDLGHDRFDVITGLLYLNDPRRDLGVHDLVYDLVHRHLVPGGRCLPDRVRYTATALDWPSQALHRHRARVSERVDTISAKHDTDFSAIRRLLEGQVPMTLFPHRGMDGRLDDRDARGLSPTTTVADIHYLGPAARLPDHIVLEIEAPGWFTTVRFVQELMLGDTLLFRNESVSWLEQGTQVQTRDRVRLDLDEHWSRTNCFTSLRRLV